jgi:hypothetical protein
LYFCRQNGFIDDIIEKTYDIVWPLAPGKLAIQRQDWGE